MTDAVCHHACASAALLLSIFLSVLAEEKVGWRLRIDRCILQRLHCRRLSCFSNRTEKLLRDASILLFGCNQNLGMSMVHLTQQFSERSTGRRGAWQPGERCKDRLLCRNRLSESSVPTLCLFLPGWSVYLWRVTSCKLAPAAHAAHAARGNTLWVKARGIASESACAREPKGTRIGQFD